MRNIMFLVVSVLALMMLQGCSDFKNFGGEVAGSDQIFESYSPALKSCLRGCQVKYADQLDDGNDARRACACKCHKANGSVGEVGQYCTESLDGILQASNADTLTDMKSKSGGW